MRTVREVAWFLAGAAANLGVAANLQCCNVNKVITNDRLLVTVILLLPDEPMVKSDYGHYMGHISRSSLECV